MMLLFGERRLEEKFVGTASPCVPDMHDPDGQAAFIASQRKSPEALPGRQALVKAV